MMNNQEFRPPDGQPGYNAPQEQGNYGNYSQQQYNDDPREQAWQAPGAVYGEKLQPQRRKRRGLRGCAIAIAITLIVLALLGTGIGFALTRLGGLTFGPGVTESHTFTVGNSPHLVLNDPTGSVRIHSSGAGNTVSIKATKATEGFGGNPNNIHINYNESLDNNTVTINVDNGPKFIGLSVVTFDITVPSAIDLSLKSSTGSIDVNGVTGQMSLQSNTGSITAEQDILTSSSSLSTDTGSVTFNGSIGQSGAYNFSTNTGSVNVTLPPDATFHLDAKTDTGSFNSDFPLINPDKQGLGSEVHGDIGTSPNTNLTLTTDTGSINLNQEK